MNTSLTSMLEQFKFLDIPSQSVDMNDPGSRFNHLFGIPLESFQKVKPRILIGMDYPKLTIIYRFKSRCDHDSQLLEDVDLAG